MTTKPKSRVLAGVREGGQFATEHREEPDVALALRRPTGHRSPGEPFQFDRDYNNHEQVRPYFAAYTRRRDELAAAGRYPYNADFVGHIPGIEGPDEDTAIYLLQRMHERDQNAAKVEEFVAAGGREITVADFAAGQVLRGEVAHHGFYSGGTGWQQFDSARLLVDRGRLVLLEKGKRTQGYWLQGKVLIREK